MVSLSGLKRKLNFTIGRLKLKLPLERFCVRMVLEPRILTGYQNCLLAHGGWPVIRLNARL